MKNTHAVIAVLICFLFVSTSLAGTNVTLLQKSNYIHYIATDPVIADFELEWTPPVVGTKKKAHLDLSAPGFASTNAVVCRSVSWSVESGNGGPINWAPVRTQLSDHFGIVIGQAIDCSIVGDVTAPECCRARIDLFSAYLRTDFTIVQNGSTAQIAVLEPIDGFARVYRELELLDYACCDGTAAPVSDAGICASADAVPMMETHCLATGTGTNKRRFDKDTAPIRPGEDTSVTWGKIKALYASD